MVSMPCSAIQLLLCCLICQGTISIDSNIRPMSVVTTIRDIFSQKVVFGPICRSKMKISYRAGQFSVHLLKDKGRPGVEIFLLGEEAKSVEFEQLPDDFF